MPKQFYGKNGYYFIYLLEFIDKKLHLYVNQLVQNNTYCIFEAKYGFDKKLKDEEILDLFFIFYSF